MQRNRFDIAMAAYTPEEYRKIQAISEDVDAMEPTWAEWRQTANQAKIQLAMKGRVLTHKSTKNPLLAKKPRLNWQRHRRRRTAGRNNEEE